MGFAEEAENYLMSPEGGYGGKTMDRRSFLKEAGSYLVFAIGVVATGEAIGGCGGGGETTNIHNYPKADDSGTPLPNGTSTGTPQPPPTTIPSGTPSPSATPAAQLNISGYGIAVQDFNDNVLFDPNLGSLLFALRNNASESTGVFNAEVYINGSLSSTIRASSIGAGEIEWYATAGGLISNPSNQNIQVKVNGQIVYETTLGQSEPLPFTVLQRYDVPASDGKMSFLTYNPLADNNNAIFARVRRVDSDGKNMEEQGIYLITQVEKDGQLYGRIDILNLPNTSLRLEIAPLGSGTGASKLYNGAP